MLKLIHEFKTGDVINYYGGQFRITKDARESQSHRPQSDHLIQAEGPSDCAVAEAVCIAGEMHGYFKPGAAWSFQGNHRAGQYRVE